MVVLLFYLIACMGDLVSDRTKTALTAHNTVKNIFLGEYKVYVCEI